MGVKDDFQSALNTLESLFTFFFFCERYHKVYTFCNYLHEVTSKFCVNSHYGCVALCFVVPFCQYLTRKDWSILLSPAVSAQMISWFTMEHDAKRKIGREVWSVSINLANGDCTVFILWFFLKLVFIYAILEKSHPPSNEKVHPVHKVLPEK